MKIAISGDCFAAFTSGFPVRGMTIKLINNHPEDDFIIYYTKRERPEILKAFYSEIDSQPNVTVRYFKYGRIQMALRRMFGIHYLKLDDDIDCFINPGNPEYISGFKGVNICSQADLSTFKGLSTNRYAFFFKHLGIIKAKRTYHKLSKIVCISNYTEKDLHSFFPNLKGKTTVIYNGIDDFWLNSDSCNDISKLNIPKSYFIWWGVISRRKNIDRLIKAYKEAKSENPALPSLLLVGRVEDYMKEIQNEFDGEDIVNIPFQKNEILRSLVANSSGVIFPSLYEGFGLPVIEAYSQGISVACSNVTSLPEIAGNRAILFNPENVGEIKDSILELYNLTVNSEDLIEYASKFTYDEAAKQYYNLISDLVK